MSEIVNKSVNIKLRKQNKTIHYTQLMIQLSTWLQ